MQLDPAARAHRTWRALRFADCDAKVPFRAVRPVQRGADIFVDLDNGVLRGKRVTWSRFYRLLPEFEDMRPTVMVELTPGCYVNEDTARLLGRTPANARSYHTTPSVRPVIRQRSFMVPPAANDNRPQRLSSIPDRAAQRAQVEATLNACADALARHRARIAARFQKHMGAASTPNRILNALEKHDPTTARQFLRLRELVRPPLVAANDNFADPDVDEKNRGWGLERVHNQGCIKPSPEAFIAAHERGAAVGIQYFKPEKPGERFRTWIGERADGKFVGVLFNHGEHGAVYYGDKKGRRRSARYEDGMLTERKLEPEQEQEELALQLAGLSSYSAVNRGPVLRGHLEESYHIGKRRWQRYSPGVASYKSEDYGRLGGISAFKGTGEGGTHAPAMAELAEYDRGDTASDFLDGLPTRDRGVVETMLVADSFAEVAAAAGKEPTSHNGKRAVLAVIEKYSEKIAA